MHRSILSLLGIAVLSNCGGGSTPTTPPPPPPPPTAASISIAPTTLALVEGEGGNLIATVKDASGATMTANVTWSAAPVGVVTISASGRVTAVASGSATVTAHVGTIEGTASVTVTPVAVASVTLSGVPPELETGEAKPLAAITRSAGGATLTGRSVTWSSSNEAAATVSQTGVITGMGSGTTTLTATSEGKSATATLRVDSRTAFLSRLADSIRVAYDVPAIGVAIVRRAEGIFGTGAAGRRRVSSPTQVTVGDLWHIGSNLKAITGFAVAIAVGQGAISWNTTLAQAYPEYAATMLPAYRNVTLQMLMAHIGGIVENVDNPAIPGNGSLTSQRANIAQWATSLTPVGPVGQHAYSNVGIMIVANMVERAMSTSWESLFQSRLLGPLGITGFGWGPAPYDQNQNPIGHERIGGAWVEGPGADNDPYLSSAGRSHWTLAAWGRVIQEIMKADQGQSTL
ncbi:MAG: serine hydrolase, partial [Gemmatimonadota bacterium]